MRLETSLSQPYDFYISFPLRQRLLHKVHKQLMLALLRASTQSNFVYTHNVLVGLQP